jgi:hypothetical protein
MSNPDRTLILDLSAIEEERGPQPNDFFVCLTSGEAAACAYAIATLLSDGTCTDRECEICNRYRKLFWEVTNELGARLQRELFACLVSTDIEVPDGPWEEVR